MDLRDYVAGEYQQEYQYKSFLPTKINHQFIWDDAQINVLLEKATMSLGELNAYTTLIPNVDIYIKMHINTEANKSSKIEGTKTEMDEMIMSKENLTPEKRDDWQEVHNYVEAINYSIDALSNLPLSNRLIRHTHKILLTNVRGDHKQPGDFRKSQNWIGGTNLSNASFIPPHHDNVDLLMGDLESFLHNEELLIPHLVKIAIAHYQFETIHPFLDGNGRIGRLLITLYLVNYNLLDKPSLYLSDFFERNKGLYYEKLTIVRQTNDLNNWIKFFLTGIIETSQKSIETFKDIMKLKEKYDVKLYSFGKKAQNANKLISYLYAKPLIDVVTVMDILAVSKPTAISLLKDFEKNGILKEVTGFQRNKLYLFEEYVNIFT